MIRCLFIQGMTDYWLQRQPWKIVQRNWLTPRGWCDFLLRFCSFLGTICSGNEEGWFPCSRRWTALVWRVGGPEAPLRIGVACLGECFSHCPCEGPTLTSGSSTRGSAHKETVGAGSLPPVSQYVGKEFTQEGNFFPRKPWVQGFPLDTDNWVHPMTILTLWTQVHMISCTFVYLHANILSTPWTFSC